MNGNKEKHQILKLNIIKWSSSFQRPPPLIHGYSTVLYIKYRYEYDDTQYSILCQGKSGFNCDVHLRHTLFLSGLFSETFFSIGAHKLLYIWKTFFVSFDCSLDPSIIRNFCTFFGALTPCSSRARSDVSCTWQGHACSRFNKIYKKKIL